MYVVMIYYDYSMGFGRVKRSSDGVAAFHGEDINDSSEVITETIKRLKRADRLSKVIKQNRNAAPHINHRDLIKICSDEMIDVLVQEEMFRKLHRNFCLPVYYLTENFIALMDLENL